MSRQSLYRYCLKVCLCGFLFTTALYAQTTHTILEIQHIEDILHHVDKDTLLVFDLDNTLIEPHQTLGSDQWFNHHVTQTKQQFGTDKSLGLSKAVNDYNAVQHRSEVRLVDPKVNTLFKQLRDKDIKILGLTSRGASLREPTVRQLASVGLSFESPWNDHDYYYPLQSAKHGGNAHAGIVLTAGAHKGDCLLEYLDHLEYTPTRVVFVDDRAEHLERVKASLVARGIHFIGFRYTYLDHKVKHFDPNIAAIQFEYLHKIISDEDARAILEARKKITFN
ncbi:MAG: hypothetical protein RLZ35_1096 [Pseudomonadota bacterium]|jgi:hypothetical protein